MNELPKHDIGQCIDCGRVYDIGPMGNSGPKRKIPEDRQPPIETDPNAPGRSPHGWKGHSTAVQRQQQGMWEGRNVSHGMCPDCEKRKSVYLAAGPERAPKLAGYTQHQANVHWWWRTPRYRRKRGEPGTDVNGRITPN